MSTSIYLAKSDDLPKLAVLVAAFHAEFGLDTDEASRERALLPLLEGSPYGAIYMIGPRVSPVGYVAVCFGWSIELGGLDGYLDEIFIRPRVRGRGMAREALSQLHRTLAQAGVHSITLEVDAEAPRTQSLYRSLGYEMRDRYRLMAKPLV